VSRAEERREARETGGSDMKKFYMLFGAVAVIGVGVVGYNVSAGMFGSAVSAPVEVEGIDDPARLVEMARGVTKGDPNAPITIVEFGDFQCPSCAQFAQAYKPQVELGYVESGQAKFVFYDNPLVSIHPNAFLAARAARCAEDQDKFWEYHDELFRQQSRWSAMPSPASAFEDYAGTVGLDQGEFAGCLNSDRHAELVTANMQLAQVMRVTGTPTILVNVKDQPTRRVASYSYQAIAETIEQMIGSGSN
jgi:protein-disulfide isomerase